MADLEAFAVTRRWPATHPDRLQLYSLNTPNGIKVAAMLEETGLAYEAHLVSFSTNDQMTPEFLSLNPNNKIPAILDPDGPGGRPMGLWESGAILLYLAEKTGQLMPQDRADHWQAVQWVMFQMGGLGPMFGQLGHFYHFAADKVTDPYPTNRYATEVTRLLGVVEGRLADRPWIMGADYGVCDITIWPWINTLLNFYKAGDRVGFEAFPRVADWFARCMARPASQKALNIPARG